MDAHSAVQATFLIYIAAMTGIGIAAWRCTRDLGDYLLGGRRIGPWVTALSAGASDMSGWLLLGLPGYAYVAGLEAGWIALGLLVGTWLNWRLVAGRLRVATEAADDALTIPEFIARRFPAQGAALRSLGALFILFFFTIYTSAGLVAAGKLFETVFGWDYSLAVVAGTVVVVTYTFLGGFLAVAWTDLVQGLMMAAALVIVPLVAFGEQGGVGAAIDTLQAAQPQLLDVFTDRAGAPLGVIAIVSLLAWGLGYFGQPHILVRFMAIRDPREMATARRIAMTWVALTLLGAVLVGIAGITGLDTPLSGADSEKVFMHLVAALFHPVTAGMLLAAILAAIMSTADSQLLVASSALTEDLYRALGRPQPDPRRLVWAGRLAVVLVAAIALTLALQPGSRILDIVAYAWAGFGAAFGPVLLFTLYWKRMNGRAALAGMLAGGLTVVLWRHIAPIEGLYEIVPGMVLAGVAIVVFGRFGGGR